jgi:hypothetical protein
MQTICFNNFKDACCYAKDKYNSVEFNLDSTIIYLEEWIEEDRFISGTLFSKNTRGIAKTYLDKARDIISCEIVEKYITDTQIRKMLKITTNYINNFNAFTDVHKIIDTEGSSVANRLLGQNLKKIIFTTTNY